MLHVHTDAAVKGNPGKAGAGIVISGATYQQLKIPLRGLWNNHLAEFEAIKQAMLWLLMHNYQDQLIFLYSDSQAATDALLKDATSNPQYADYVKEIYTLEKNFHFMNIDWVPEKENLGADQLAKQALQQALKNK